MKKQDYWTFSPGVTVSTAEKVGPSWIMSATLADCGLCPDYNSQSRRRHGSYLRRMQDLAIQGAAVTLRLRITRWRCEEPGCLRGTFADRLTDVTRPFARRTGRVAELAGLIAHTAGGRPAGRLMARLGIPQSKDTLLRSLKRSAPGRDTVNSVRFVGVDDWSWRKGTSYGTIMVDLERREVLEVLTDRSADSTALWLQAHPAITSVSRDRCGLYAHAATRGAPQAHQVADRFHLLQNLRHSIEHQLVRGPSPATQFVPPEPMKPVEPAGLYRRYGQPEVTEHRRRLMAGRYANLREGFDRVKALLAEGKSFTDVSRATGFTWRTVRKWSEWNSFRPRASMAPKSTTPDGFRDYLAKRWNEGCTMGRQLLAEIRSLGYTGSLTHLQRLLNKWRQAHLSAVTGITTQEQPASIGNTVPCRVPPIVGAALCIKPRGLMTDAQAVKVKALKETSPDFAMMRQLALRFRGIIRGKDAKPLDAWLSDAASSGLHSIRQFANALRHDLAAVRNAITEQWSNGQTEGQINRLKTLKRAMYGRAGLDLLRIRILPFHANGYHTE